VVDHLCRNRACVCPDHLEAVTLRTNLLRGDTVTARNSTVAACPKGHLYSGDNLRTDDNGWRHCRSCKREYDMEYRQRKALVDGTLS
jgi:hypothetical protein